MKSTTDPVKTASRMYNYAKWCTRDNKLKKWNSLYVLYCSGLDIICYDYLKIYYYRSPLHI